MHGDVLLDRFGKFGDAAEDAIAQTGGGDFAKEPLGHFELGCRGSGEMNMERGCFAIHCVTFGCLCVA